MSETLENTKLSQEELEDLVIQADTGARKPKSPFQSGAIVGIAFLWALFQLWIASPLQFDLGFFILNDTETRSIHLAFAILLSFMAYPALKWSPRDKIPILDWVWGIAGCFCASYIYLFSEELAGRSGLPTTLDVTVASIGLIVLLEATRRALGPPLLLIASVFLLYVFFGSSELIPEVIRHKGQSLNKVASHMWLTTEGVFGIALGVSSSFVFLFVLFGSLLDKAGAGNYFIKVAFALLGHLRGGPAKAAVLSSGMTGLISGSSIANTVTTGTFTIPLMRRVGFSGEKAGAIEVSASVNGQIMPPVMGAAAFIMVEYVGISYLEVIKHAFVPAMISYIALLYIVHLEAVKADLPSLPKLRIDPWKQRLIGWGIISSSLLIIAGIAYFAISTAKEIFGDSSFYVVVAALFVVYLALIAFASKFPDLEVDDPDAPILELPEAGATIKTGLHYLLPIVVLVWCLMIERFSPGLSAFWATILMIVILATQDVLKNAFRKEGKYLQALRKGLNNLFEGMVVGSRNMIGIGVATAAAGIIVGTVSLTGIGQVLAQFIEFLAGDSMLLVLLFTGIVCLILGMGLPTTANYIVVASLMAQVVVELGTQNGLVIPLIAVHLFVFYFGIMADVTPPVGLASFAAAAISGADPIKTGIQAFTYSIRTAILPFFFILNTELILIGVDSLFFAAWIFVKATAAILIFSAAAQNYFLVRSRFYETIILYVVATTLFVPNVILDFIQPPYVKRDPWELEKVVMDAQPGDNIKVVFEGEDFDNPGHLEDVKVLIKIGEGNSFEERLHLYGITAFRSEGRRLFVDDTKMMSDAEAAGITFDFEVIGLAVHQERISPRWLNIPAVILLLIVVASQSVRRKRDVALKKL